MVTVGHIPPSPAKNTDKKSGKSQAKMEVNGVIFTRGLKSFQIYELKEQDDKP